MSNPDLDFDARREHAMRQSALKRIAREEHWLSKIEALQPGDRCEFHYPARQEWRPGVVKVNGGAGYWTIIDETEKKIVSCVYIEQVRLPGQTEAWAR